MLPKKHLSTLILTLIVYASYLLFSQAFQPTELNVLGAQTNLRLFEQPESGQQQLVDAIESAEREILVEIYLLSDKKIINALVDAREHGVKVMVMMEQHPFGGSALNPKTKKELDSHAVLTQWSNPSFALTHEKAIIIDANKAFILTQNLTTSSFSKNREYDILDTNPIDVTEIRNIFIADWERKSFSPPANTNIIESPDNSRPALTSLLNNATQTIDAETEDIVDTKLVQLLSNKAKTTKIRLLVPTLSQLEANEPALSKLQKSGVQVKTIFSPYMHAKMIIADDKKAYVGSINFSTQSMDKNRELGIILTQEDIIQTLSTTFQTDWNKALPH
jgi:phosphatidylserine/phosphatidylglycerophosphate/cardiolipin synthase-like enzyme